MNRVNVMFTFRHHSVITTVDVENIDEAVEAARELLRLEGVSTDAQDITLEVIE